MNHLIEYYSVLRKSIEMIFGEDQVRDQKLSFSISNTESVEDLLLADSRRDDGRASDASDNSDDQLFDRKYCLRHLRMLRF